MFKLLCLTELCCPDLVPQQLSWLVHYAKQVIRSGTLQGTGLFPSALLYSQLAGEPAWCSLHSGSKLLNQLGRPLTVPARYLRPVQLRRPLTVPVWILQTKQGCAFHVER
ncbi:mediator of RNA polymerase II transcription subunit 12-like [Dorcoceras hygrometricum]|uniref:Mediator of RNA polymerase II transcription subunit 12-like n=1 Tax=Dorcoceras hygrometricum TaxID=472368 RepID=A0A2Z7BP78_9LAMI|nr:mediator of RNA polymerase II transcription subunit 12-like [Dorcoceras hygrometricum]